MPKKFKRSYPSKPQSTVHPSLSSSGRHGTAAAEHSQQQQQDGSSTASVNEILTRLRGAEIRSEPHQDVSPATRPIRLFPASQHQPPPHLLTPRARMIERARLRSAPGPAAPASWTRPGQARARMDPPRTATQLEAAAAELSRRNDRLPGLKLPAKGSLVYCVLRRIALDWNWFIYEEGVNLAFLPQHLKKYLLALLIIYGPGLIAPQELELLFLDDLDVEGATGAYAITHVHAAFMANPATGLVRGYKDLQNLLFGEEYVKASKASQNSSSGDVQCVPESWEDEADAGGNQRASQQALRLGTTIKPRFAAMTHLDLSHAPFASWRFLLRDLTPHLKQLTHLSLAFWPLPSLTSNSRNTVLISASGSLDSRTLNWYHDVNSDWTEAVGVIQRLGKDLPSLRWLDLEGCSSQGGWIEALSSRSPEGNRQVDWAGTFRGLETLKIGQGATPDPLKNMKSMREFLEEWITRAMIDLRRDTSVREWMEANARPVLEQIADQMRGRFFFDETAALDLWLWLEREYRVINTARHIDAARLQSGLPRSLAVVCSERPAWTEPLIRHERRGVDVDEQLRDGLDIFRRIVPPDQMASVAYLMKRKFGF